MGNGLSITSYICAGCGTSVTRPPTKGQRPKWCDDCRTKGVRQQRTITCALCGEICTTWRSGRFCSRDCATLSLCKPAKTKLPTDRRTPLRRAWESEDWLGVLSELEARAVKVDSCWLWPSKNKDGYGVLAIAGRSYGVHRVAMAARSSSSHTVSSPGPSPLRRAVVLQPRPLTSWSRRRRTTRRCLSAGTTKSGSQLLKRRSRMSRPTIPR